MSGHSIGDGFILNMTSDSKVRGIVARIRELSRQTTTDVPRMSEFFSLDSQDELTDRDLPVLPFSVFLITGTAGAGKSTCISALYQNLNCLITGATTVAAQNLSKLTKSHCTTIFHAFRFKSRHVGVPLNYNSISTPTSIGEIQKAHLMKYWPVIRDITEEFMRTKPAGKFATLKGTASDLFLRMGPANLWTSNVIVIDEAGTLSAYILTAVVYFYWFFNSWLQSPLFREGRIPCVVCVGSPTQTSAFESAFNHSLQRYIISRSCDILTFLIASPVLDEALRVSQNWALFINNKRCLDPTFSHMLKTLEYNLEITDDVMAYLDRFVVHSSRIMNPLEFVGWTRLFMSHHEVKSYISLLHSTLEISQQGEDAILFTCPIICEIHCREFEDYKRFVNLGNNVSALEWLTKNLNRLSNYSQFADQDMTASSVDRSDEAVRITYSTKFVRDSAVSLNAKTKVCTFGFSGTYRRFCEVLESDAFLDAHAGDRPEFVYNFLNLLLYNAMYSYVREGLERKEVQYLAELQRLPCDPVILAPREDWDDYGPRDGDQFYEVALFPPSPGSTGVQEIIRYYTGLKDLFFRRLAVARRYFGTSFENVPFTTFTSNIRVRNGIEYLAHDGDVRGFLEYATTVENFTIKGFTTSRVAFGSFGAHTGFSADISTLMPCLVISDASGFVSCLERNVTRLTETMDDGVVFNICTVADYGVSSKLAMTIVKSQGMSLEKVAISFGNHRDIKKGHVYVAISRTTNPSFLVMDKNPLVCLKPGASEMDSSNHILAAINSPTTLLVY